MRIIHLSDIHLENNGVPIWETDTMCHLNKAINIIKSLANVDVIVVSGDLSNDGSRWTYEYIDEIFETTGIPTICCPGNHDSISMMYNEYLPRYYQICDKIYIGGFKFLMLNSTIPADADPTTNKSRGLLTNDKLNFIKNEIKDGTSTIIVLHHPPLEPGGWLNRKLLDNRDEFVELISGYSNVKLILYGHIHYPTQNDVNGIKFSSAPSIGFAFDKDLPKFQIAKGNEGFSLIDITESNITIKTIHL